MPELVRIVGLHACASRLIAALLCSLLVTTSAVADVNTAEIVSTTTRAIPNCLKWKLVGECFWLHCDLISGCSIRVSAKVAHYRPDSVVSVYPHIDSHPWREVKLVVRNAFRAAIPSLGSKYASWLHGNGPEPAMDRFDSASNLRYFESDLVGHPLNEIEFPGADYICDSVTTPLIPHYSSLVDLLAWRDPTIENFHRASLVPGLREVGNWPVNTWGPIYPRSGWINQPSAPKAAAVIAQRAADIAINGGALRVRNSMSGGRVNLWPPSGIRENDAGTAKWQMLYPQKENRCSVFGTNDLNSIADWGAHKVDDENAYMWSLWRPYKCCPRRGQRFLGSDDVRGYP